MIKRLFKLLYVFALIALALELPIYILTSIDYERIVLTSYKARCLSNNQYIVLQGSPANDALVFNEISYNNDNLLDTNDTKRDLNFYCKYYAEVQPHIIAYNQARTSQEQVRANQEFFTFKEGVISSVSGYPMLYELEVVKNELQPHKIYGPIIDGVISVLVLFTLIQIARMSYIYVVFGKIIWHPFRKIKNT